MAAYAVSKLKLRLIIAHVVNNNYIMRHLYIKSAFIEKVHSKNTDVSQLQRWDGSFSDSTKREIHFELNLDGLKFSENTYSEDVKSIWKPMIPAHYRWLHFYLQNIQTMAKSVLQSPQITF